MDQKTWIVVANSAQARIFKCETINKLIEIETFIHPESRSHGRDLASDRSGSVASGTGQYSMNQPHSPKELEPKYFAKKVAAYLELARTRGELQRLFIAANPSFLGEMRNEMSALLTKIISKSVDKDITHLKPTEIKDYFFVGV